jgi:hypothetical protein
MSQVHTFSLENGLTPSVEVFCVDAVRSSQKADAGWYYQMSIEGREVGEPQGPFPSDQEAVRAARSLFVQ